MFAFLIDVAPSGRGSELLVIVAVVVILIAVVTVVALATGIFVFVRLRRSRDKSAFPETWADRQSDPLSESSNTPDSS
jgi:flagellar basal body-associated protein FliL